MNTPKIGKITVETLSGETWIVEYYPYSTVRLSISKEEGDPDISVQDGNTMNTQGNQEDELKFAMKVTDAIAQHGSTRPTPANEWPEGNMIFVSIAPDEQQGETHIHPAKEWCEEWENDAFHRLKDLDYDTRLSVITWFKNITTTILTTHSAHLVEKIESLKKKVKVCDDQQSYPMCSNCEGGYSECLWAREDNKHNQSLDQAVDIVSSK